MTDHRSFHDGCQDGLKALHSLDLDQVHTFKGLVQAMGRTAFGGRRLGEALEVLTEMARTPGCFKVMSISGAMTVAKQGKIVSDLIDRGVVDAIVATGALVTHGLTESFGNVHYAVPHDANDEELFDKGYNRIYDTLEMEANLNDLAEIIAGIMDRQQRSEPWCSSAICRAIGEELDRRDEGPGILRSAYRRGVPVYIPAFTDSEMGLDLATWAMARKRGTDGEAADCFNHVPSYNPFLDLQDYAQRAIAADTLGIFTIGGGVPRNWAQQVGPYADITARRLGISLPEIKFKYAVRICPEPDHWGGLSGCSYSEGVSWGKFIPQSEGGRHSEVHADATTVLPLLAKALFENLES
ncbi:MAG: deoxyhypusine synthase family protein [Candidatus Hydrogenedentes bacterium]|nr:deoxyhypusine synthase family protein [Candidatus Hydrogenedentota bacterium]